MPIAPNLITHAEVILHGHAASGGSSTFNTVNTFHFRRTSTVNPLSKVDLDTIFQSTIGVVVRATINNRWAQTFNTVRWLDDATDPPFQINHAGAGGVAGDSMPSENYIYFLYRTGLRGKSYRGNLKIGPASESSTTAGTDDILNAAGLVLAANLITALTTPLVDAGGNTWVLQVLSRKLSSLVKNPTNVIANDVQNILVNKRIGELKKRKVASAY